MSAPDILGLFEKNAFTYDRVNSIISLGLDGGWRRWVARQAAWRPAARILDAFSGTGLVGIKASEMGADVTLADFSPQMLSVAGAIAERRGALVDIKPVDLTQKPLPFKKESFDAITMVFGIRYLKDPVPVIAELASLLKPNGRLVVLEFVMPPAGVVPALASLYFFNILPRIASVLARQRELYDYLISSVKSIGQAGELLAVISDAGLGVLEMRQFGFGLVCGIVAVRQNQCQ